MEQQDSRISRVESQIDSIQAWQVETAALQAETLTEIKATNEYLRTQVEKRIEDVEKDMSMWKRFATAIGIVSSAISAIVTWFISKQ